MYDDTPMKSANLTLTKKNPSCIHVTSSANVDQKLSDCLFTLMFIDSIEIRFRITSRSLLNLIDILVYNCSKIICRDKRFKVLKSVSELEILLSKSIFRSSWNVFEKYNKVSMCLLYYVNKFKFFRKQFKLAIIFYICRCINI